MLQNGELIVFCKNKLSVVLLIHSYLRLLKERICVKVFINHNLELKIWICCYPRMNFAHWTSPACRKYSVQSQSSLVHSSYSCRKVANLFFLNHNLSAWWLVCPLTALAHKRFSLNPLSANPQNGQTRC